MYQIPNITQLAETFVHFVKANSTTILTVTAVAGVVGTAIVTFKQAPKAQKVLNELKEDLKEEEDKEARRGIIFSGAKRIAWYTLPIVITAGFSIASIIGMNHIHSQRYAAVSAAYAIADRSLKEWKEKTEEVIGAKKTEDIKMAIADEKAKKIHETDEDLKLKKQIEENQLMYDPLDIVIDSVTGTTFYSSSSRIREAFAKLQTELNGCDYVSINDLYRYLEIRACKIGERLGWNNFDPTFSSGNTTEIEYRITCSRTAADRPCLVLDYDAEPRRDSWGDKYDQY